MSEIKRENNRILIKGNISGKDSHYLFFNLFDAIEKKGYQDIEIDFSECTAIYPTTMMSLCSYTKKYNSGGCDFNLYLPKKEQLAKLFKNSNWAHLIDPKNYHQSKFSGFRQVPATCFKTPEGQEEALRKIINSLLASYPGLERNAFSAIEWSINEIMDNVLVHSKSPFGGLVQMTTYNNYNRKIEIIVSDAGVGIPKTLENILPEIDSDIKALMYCIKEGVTNGKGQGNGLFGTFNICSESDGMFSIDSGAAVLFYNNKDGMHIKHNRIPLTGTTVTATINCNTKDLLEKALNFKNIIYHPVDYIEYAYEMDDRIVFEMVKETHSFGSRVAGTPLRNKLYNIITMTDDIVYIDFDEINIASSSFIDESIVKLIEKMGKEDFKRKCRLININQTLMNILNKSYKQRLLGEVKEIL